MKPDQRRYTTQLDGRTVTVHKVAVEQDINHRHRGKWVVVNEATGRKLHRTERQLHLVVEEGPTS